jgi:hypothetical protein
MPYQLISMFIIGKGVDATATANFGVRTISVASFGRSRSFLKFSSFDDARRVTVGATDRDVEKSGNIIQSPAISFDFGFDTILQISQ